MKSQSGFTLIELVVVIVVLGILSAIAVPKFINLKTESEAAALSGVAGAMSSAMAINYAGRTVTPTKGAAVDNCDDVASLMEGGLPVGYTVASTAIGAGASVTCEVEQTSTSNTAEFTGIGIN